MKTLFMVSILFLIPLNFGCESRFARQDRFRHEETMAQIKAQVTGMSEKDKAQLADMIADKVVEKLKSEQK
jgi:hypothetical protein